MAYKVDIHLLALSEIDEAIEYYTQINPTIPEKFLSSLNSAYENLSKNPFFQKRYKNIRSVPLVKFPFLLFFTVDEENKKVKILSCFHTSQNPEKYKK